LNRRAARIPAAGASGSKFEEVVVCLDGSRTAAAIVPTAAAYAADLGVGVSLVGVIDAEWQAAAATAGQINSDTGLTQSTPGDPVKPEA